VKRIRPKQSLGQHFLRDNNIARKIIGSLHIQRDDLVLEIGPGEGALTHYLARQTDHLTVVDVDERVIARMNAVYPHGEVAIVHQDFLDVDLASVRAGDERKLRIVGNIPYNITTPILFHILDHRENVQDATLMMQREVARRLVAQPRTKDYGILAVFCQMFADVTLLFDVSAQCFFPPPGVTSSVVRLTMLPEPRFPLTNEGFFRSMVRAVFGKRRKTLRNSLRYLLDVVPEPMAGIDLAQRPEDLPLEKLAALANALARHKAAQ